MKKFYVCSNDKDVTEVYGNSTMVFWKICDKTDGNCPVLGYFLNQPVRFHRTNCLSDRQYLFNFSVVTDIDKIRLCVQKAVEICKNCNGR